MRTLVFTLAAGVVLLAASLSLAQECSEEIAVETTDGTITMTHYEARFNCCAWLSVEVEQEGFTIDFLEREMFAAGPCYCLCCFGAEASISGLAPGEYHVNIWKLYNNGDDTWVHELVGEWIVPVSGTSEASVSTVYLPCVEAIISDPDVSWGLIKALYR